MYIFIVTLSTNDPPPPPAPLPTSKRLQPLALPGRRRDSGSLTPSSRIERQSHESAESLADGSSTVEGAVPVGVRVGGEGGGPVMHKLFSIELRRTQIQVHGVNIVPVLYDVVDSSMFVLGGPRLCPFHVWLVFIF